MKNFLLPFFLLGVVACEKVDITPASSSGKEEMLSLQDVAKMLSLVGMDNENLQEVYDAVSSSSDNGYDEEYTMKDLFSCPGAGVGDMAVPPKSLSKSSYSHPLREVIREYFSSPATKSSGEQAAEEYLEYLSSGDMQIYWPFSDNWDGRTSPVITFDPLSDISTNVGYVMGDDGVLEEVLVSEEMAKERPVWVVNNNDDASYVSLETIRRDNPELLEGGYLDVKGRDSGTKAVNRNFKTLVLKDFTMLRQYDCWLAGASEFFIKLGAIESFTASTEAEMYLYNPSITDFMIVVKRSELNCKKEMNTILVSDWTNSLDSVAFMMIEDDGGTQTTWNCSAVVKYNSKSYGFEIKLPLHSRDDIVWRGTLSRNYIEGFDGVTGSFGDVNLTFALL